MIVKILSRGKSFKGLGTYLTHDPKTDTTKRVGWTHTLNLANDHVPSAIDEMLWTSRNAELLKQEAGIRAGGRATENAVKHISLNWALEDEPTREHMIETTEGFLRRMKWDEHQAVLVAHTDRAFNHVHVMLNVVHCETGLRLDDNFERRRAQAWALDYEREQGRIHCEQRLKDVQDREEAPTRPAWTAFQKRQQEFERYEYARGQEPILIRELENPKITNSDEWKMLKEFQRDQRMDFFADGKSAFSELRSSIYREVREEFRERWSDFYTAKENGTDSDALARTKADLVAEQKLVLETRRDAACHKLRESRDSHYRELLDGQRESRLGLSWRQEAGLENTLFFDQLGNRNEREVAASPFRDAADEATVNPANEALTPEAPNLNGRPQYDDSHMRSGTDVGYNLGVGIGFSLISMLDSVADGMMGAKPAPRPPPPPEPDTRRNPFAGAIDDALTRQRRLEDEEDEQRRKQRSLDGE